MYRPMSSVRNKPYIDKCILSFSHDRYPSRKLADAASLEKARREIAAGKRGISHLILRAEDDTIDRLKFLFPVYGIPIMCYALANLLHSSLKEIVVIGSPEVERVLNAYLDTIGGNGKSVSFVREEVDNLSLVNTMNLGWQKLSRDARGELVLFQPGDLPFLYDMEKVLRDRDVEHYNLILWLNARDKMFSRRHENPDSEFVARNYHYRMIDTATGELLDVKEPNVYPINLAVMEPDLIELLHHTRKDGKIFKAGISKALKHPDRFLRLAPVLARQFLRFNSDLRNFRPRDEYQFGMHRENFNRGASILLNTPFTSKVHNDPALVADVDALEDWEDFESLSNHAHQRHGEEGLPLIHPRGQDLLLFKTKAMPKLSKHIPMLAGFPAYMNNLYNSLEMPHTPFDAKGNYVMPEHVSKKTENAFLWYSEKTRQMPQSSRTEESKPLSA